MTGKMVAEWTHSTTLFNGWWHVLRGWQLNSEGALCIFHASKVLDAGWWQSNNSRVSNWETWKDSQWASVAVGLVMGFAGNVD